MPSNMSKERKAILEELGADLILCSEGDFAEAARIRDELGSERRYFNTNQFSNQLNVECHYITGKEILNNLVEKTKEIVEKSLHIAADICVYTNHHLSIEELNSDI